MATNDPLAAPGTEQEEDPFKSITARDVLLDPEFYKLPTSTRKSVLTRVWPEFAGHPVDVQENTLKIAYEDWDEYYKNKDKGPEQPGFIANAWSKIKDVFGKASTIPPGTWTGPAAAPPSKLAAPPRNRLVQPETLEDIRAKQAQVEAEFAKTGKIEVPKELPPPPPMEDTFMTAAEPGKTDYPMGPPREPFKAPWIEEGYGGPRYSGYFQAHADALQSAGWKVLTSSLLKGAAGLKVEGPALAGDIAGQMARMGIGGDIGFVLQKGLEDKRTTQQIQEEYYNNPLWKFGEQIENAIDQMYPVNPDFAQNFSYQLASGAGSMMGFMAGGVIAKTLGLPSLLATTGLGALSQVVQPFEDALENGATPEDLRTVFLANMGLGATEGLPIEHALAKADTVTGGWFTDWIKNYAKRVVSGSAVKQGLEEGIQEFIQQLGQNLTSKYTYRPDQDIWEGVKMNTLSGAILGAVTGGLATQVGIARMRQNLREYGVPDTEIRKMEETARKYDDDLSKASEEYFKSFGEAPTNLLVPRDLQTGVNWQRDYELAKQRAGMIQQGALETPPVAGQTRQGGLGLPPGPELAAPAGAVRYGRDAEGNVILPQQGEPGGLPPERQTTVTPTAAPGTNAAMEILTTPSTQAPPSETAAEPPVTEQQFNMMRQRLDMIKDGKILLPPGPEVTDALKRGLDRLDLIELRALRQRLGIPMAVPTASKPVPVAVASDTMKYAQERLRLVKEGKLQHPTPQERQGVPLLNPSPLWDQPEGKALKRKPARIRAERRGQQRLFQAMKRGGVVARENLVDMLTRLGQAVSMKDPESGNAVKPDGTVDQDATMGFIAFTRVIDPKTGEEKAISEMDPDFLRTMAGNLYKGNLYSVVLRETLQNSADAISELPDQTKGKVRYELDLPNRSFTITDNGIGMTPDVVFNELVNMGGSKKGKVSRGGFGIAKAAIFANAEKIHVVTRAFVPDGRLMETEFTGTAMDWLDTTKGFKPKSKEVPASRGTGTKIEFTANQNARINDDLARLWVRKTIDRHRAPFNVSASVNGTETDPNVHGWNWVPVRNTRSLQALGGRIEMLISDEVEDTQTVYVEVMNGGLPQFDMSITLPYSLPISKRIVADITPSGKPDADMNYPFTPDRSDVRAGVEELIKDYVTKELFKDLAAKNKQQYLDSLKNAPKIPNSRMYVVDTQRGLPAWYVEDLAKNPYVHDLMKMIQKLDRDVKDLLVLRNGPGTKYGKSIFVGMGVGPGYLGINIAGDRLFSDPAKQNLILINPFLIMKEVNAMVDGKYLLESGVAQEVADQIVATIIHENTHDLAFSHNGDTALDFSGQLTRNYGMMNRLAFQHGQKLRRLLERNDYEYIKDLRYDLDRSEHLRTEGEDIFKKIGTALTGLGAYSGPEGNVVPSEGGGLGLGEVVQRGLETAPTLMAPGTEPGRGEAGLVTPPEAIEELRKPGVINLDKLGRIVSPENFTQGWILPDGTLRQTGSHEGSIAEAAGISLNQAVKQIYPLAAQGGVVRFLHHEGKTGTKVVAEIYNAPTDEQIRALRTLEKIGQHLSGYDRFLFSITDPTKKKSIATGRAVKDIRASLPASWKPDLAPPPARLSEKLDQPRNIMDARDRSIIEKRVAKDQGSLAAPPTMQELKVEGVAPRTLIDKRRLGYKIKVKDLNRRNLWAIFITRDGEIFEVGDLTHSEALHNAYLGDIPGKPLSYFLDWHLRMRETGLVRGTYASGEVGADFARDNPDTVGWELHAKPSVEQLTTMAEIMRVHRQDEFKADVVRQEDGAWRPEQTAYRWVDFLRLSDDAPDTVLEMASRALPRMPGFNPQPTGYEVTTPSISYGQGSADKVKGERVVDTNIWTRRSPDADNSNRTLMVQFASDLLQTAPRNASDDYYDKLYNNRTGYDRPADFWEIPQWQAALSYTMPEADSYVVRNVEEAIQFFNQAGYRNIAFSALDVNKGLIQQVAQGYPGQIVVGGYTDMSAFQGVPNIRVEPSIKSFVESQGGTYKPGFDYSLFSGTSTIPRLTMSDGCLHSCVFCSVPKKITEKTLDEILQQVDAFAGILNAELIYLNDKTFGQAKNHKLLPEVYRHVKETNPNFQGFVIQTTAAQVSKMDPEFIRDAGIKYVEIGLESFNDPILKAHRKPANEKLINAAAETVREAGATLIPNIMIGLPGETADSYRKTLTWLKRNADVISHANIYNLAVYDEAELSKRLKPTTVTDQNENVIEKSWMEDPAVHTAFHKEVFDLSSGLLDVDPVSGKTKAVQLEEAFAGLPVKLEGVPPFESELRAGDEISKTISVSTKPGGMPAFAVPLEELMAKHQRIVENSGFNAETKTFDWITELGINHEVVLPHGYGTWVGPEPNLRIKFGPDVPIEKVHWVASLLGEAWGQEAIGVSHPDSKVSTYRGVVLEKPDGSVFTPQEIETMARTAKVAFETGPDNKFVFFNQYDPGQSTFVRDTLETIKALGLSAADLKPYKGDSHLVERSAGDYRRSIQEVRDFGRSTSGSSDLSDRIISKLHSAFAAEYTEESAAVQQLIDADRTGEAWDDKLFEWISKSEVARAQRGSPYRVEGAPAVPGYPENAAQISGPGWSGLEGPVPERLGTNPELLRPPTTSGVGGPLQVAPLAPPPLRPGQTVDGMAAAKAVREAPSVTVGGDRFKAVDYSNTTPEAWTRKALDDANMQNTLAQARSVFLQLRDTLAALMPDEDMRTAMMNGDFLGMTNNPMHLGVCYNGKRMYGEGGRSYTFINMMSLLNEGYAAVQNGTITAEGFPTWIARNTVEALMHEAMHNVAGHGKYFDHVLEQAKTDYKETIDSLVNNLTGFFSAENWSVLKGLDALHTPWRENANLYFSGLTDVANNPDAFFAKMEDTRQAIEEKKYKVGELPYPEVSPNASGLVKKPIEIQRKYTPEEEEVPETQAILPGLILPSAAPKTPPNVVDIGWSLAEWYKSHHGSMPVAGKKGLEPAQEEAVVKRLVQHAGWEFMYQISQDSASMEWYLKDIKRTRELSIIIDPSLKDEGNWKVFVNLLGLLSPGNKVTGNFNNAVMAYRLWRKTGTIPIRNPRSDTGSWGALGFKSYAMNLFTLQKLLDAHGKDANKAVEWLLTEHPVRELKKLKHSMAKTGAQVKGGNDTLRLGSYMFGEKVGAFIPNMLGKQSELTADRWWSRTWNRIMGTQDIQMVKNNETGEFEYTLEDAPRNFSEHQLMRKAGGELSKILGVKMAQMQAVIWYFEQSLFAAHGGLNEAVSFSDAAEAYLERESLEYEKEPEVLQPKIEVPTNYRDASEPGPYALVTGLPGGAVAGKAEVPKGTKKLAPPPPAEEGDVSFDFGEGPVFEEKKAEGVEPRPVMEEARAKRTQPRGVHVYGGTYMLNPPPGMPPPPAPGAPPGGALPPGTIINPNTGQPVTPLPVPQQGVPRRKKTWAEGFRRILNPPGRGPEAKIASGSMRAHLAEKSLAALQTEQALQEAAEFFRWKPNQENLEFIDAIEAGQTQRTPSTPKGVIPKVAFRIASKFKRGLSDVDAADLDAWASEMRTQLDDRVQQVQALGTGHLQNVIQNYFPHIWKDPAAATDFYASFYGHRPFEGSKSFLRKRSIPTTRDGVAAGLEPVSYNPAELVMLKIREIDRYIAAHRVMQDMAQRGLLATVPEAGKMPPGYAYIDDKIGKKWTRGATGQLALAARTAAPEPVALIINNYLTPGLRGWAMYDAIRNTGNLMNMAQLGMSGFHLTFTAFDAMNSSASTALLRLSRGEVGEAAKAFVNLPLRPFQAFAEGRQILLGALSGNPQSQQIADMIDTALKGGAGFKMDSFYDASVLGKFLNDLHRGGFKGYGMASLRFPALLVETASRPILDYLVPRMKLGVMADMIRYELDHLPPNATEDQQREAIGKVVDSVDNRMGQLRYDNLGWNRVLKDILMASVRSVGWNLGTFREFGGAAVDTATMAKNAKQIAQGKVPLLTHRQAYAIMTPITMAIVGAIFQLLHSGDWPDEWRDYWFPKTGRTLPNGDDERVAMPSYMKDIYAYGKGFGTSLQAGVKQAGTTLSHKLHPLLNSVADLIKNEDYYGNVIVEDWTNPGSVVKDLTTFIGKQFLPFSLRNLEQRRQGIEPPGGKGLPQPLQDVESFFGVVPAPASVRKTAAEQKLDEFISKRMPKGAKSKIEQERQEAIRDMFKIYREGGEEAAKQFQKQNPVLRQKDIANIRKKAGLSHLAYGAKRLTMLEALEVYEEADDNEREELLPILMKKRASMVGKSRMERQMVEGTIERLGLKDKLRMAPVGRGLPPPP